MRAAEKEKNMAFKDPLGRARLLSFFVVLDTLHWDDNWHCQAESAKLYTFTLALKQTWVLKALTSKLNEFLVCALFRKSVVILSHWAPPTY